MGEYRPKSPPIGIAHTRAWSDTHSRVIQEFATNTLYASSIYDKNDEERPERRISRESSVRIEGGKLNYTGTKASL